MSEKILMRASLTKLPGIANGAEPTWRSRNLLWINLLQGLWRHHGVAPSPYYGCGKKQLHMLCLQLFICMKIRLLASSS